MHILMVMGEISILPVGTGNTSVSFYVARAIESIYGIKGLTWHLNAMGTILESDDMSTILEAVNTMVITLHNLGVNRVNVVLKIDSRRDKKDGADDKIKAVLNHMPGP